MKKCSIYDINKIDFELFENSEQLEEKYFISVVDIVGVISESKDGRKYWNKLKQRLKEEGNETVTN